MKMTTYNLFGLQVTAFYINACRNGGISAFLETIVLVESSGIFSNFGAESPPLLQAAKRYML